MELKLEFVTGQDKDGEDIIEVRTFVTNKIKTRLARRAVEIEQELNKDDRKSEILDKIADFMCEVYGNKFTRDQLYDGLESDLLIPTLRETVEGVISGVTKGKLDTLPPQVKKSWRSWRS